MSKIADFLNSLRWPAVALAGMYGLFLLGGKAAEWIWVFAYNLRWPLLFFTVAASIAGIVVNEDASRVRKATRYGDPENTDAKWRQMMALQGCLILIIATVFAFAIPQPEYDKVTVPGPERIVRVPGPVQWRNGQKLVEKPPVYLEFFKTCMDNQYQKGTDQSAQCHKQSLEAVTASKGQRVVVQVKHDTYRELFKACNDDYSLDGIPNAQAVVVRNERLAICHKAALEASR